MYCAEVSDQLHALRQLAGGAHSEPGQDVGVERLIRGPFARDRMSRRDRSTPSTAVSVAGWASLRAGRPLACPLL